MSCKSITVIPTVFKFQSSLGIKRRNIKVAFFIPNNFSNLVIHSTDKVLSRMKFFDLVGFFTNEKSFQRGSHRMRKIFDLHNQDKLDLLICKSKSDLDRYEDTIDSIEKSIFKSGIPTYCIKDCILIKNGNIISQS
ncbi:hypothetical protein SAMN02745248_00785 [Hathewaya proteolytica DSM 3090]|uniref:Uncharacterized protein n=1 Tax=Hathewaya proteolytica DSM 3090 TaxID=1121331 RepID=A0A1M6LQX9_9CLOT|nr:hypothetical protein [Hathewaya proteolytica]SHJ73570.1 hypothetical protein SAMN02745248_00785 [Hathewaya proteolytica DSM 3090]